MWTIVVFIAGIFVGQEIEELPRIKPILVAGGLKLVEFMQSFNSHIDHSNNPQQPVTSNRWWKGNNT